MVAKLITNAPQYPGVQAPEMPFDEDFLGWRYTQRFEPDGTEVIEARPLTPEDFLAPEEGDRPVVRPTHTRDFLYLYAALSDHYQDQYPPVGPPEPPTEPPPDTTLILGDCRLIFPAGHTGPLGPDLIVLKGVRSWDPSEGTFYPGDRGGRAVAIIEVTSPGTRDVDLRGKPPLYHLIGAEVYAIVDHGPTGQDPPQLLGYRRGPQGWLHLPLNAQGQLDLSPLPFLLGLEDGKVWLYHQATGERLPEFTEAMARVTAALKSRAQAEADKAQAEAARIAAEADRAQAEAARTQAEADRAQAEAARSQAETDKAQAEAARAAAEAARAAADAARSVAEQRAQDAAAMARQAESAVHDLQARYQAEAQARADAEARAREAEARARDAAAQTAALARELAELKARLAQKPPDAL